MKHGLLIREVGGRQLHQQWVGRDINFNPVDHFEDIQLLDLEGCDSKWNTLTAEDLQRASKHGKISLQEKCGEK